MHQSAHNFTVPLREWWKRCAAKDNLPDGIELVTAARQNSIQQILDAEADKYDVVMMDSPGTDSVVRDTIIRRSDLILTPIQPNQDEIKAAGEAAEAAAEVSDQIGRAIPQANFVTRLTIPARNLEAYRLIRPFVQNLRENGYASYLLLLERNCYREVRNGYGTLQMLELTEQVKKARAEGLLVDIESLLATSAKEATNG
ncbi:ParA family protein [Rhizobium mongolense]|uniref:ParA family protein n=1 Tax=Rhizobium mongolense TaxID=57676 RepID=UPI0034A1739C